MRVHIASDHGGFDLKEALAKRLRAAGHDVVDHGNRVFDPADDYPDFILPLGEAVIREPGSLGIVLGRSGNGEAIAANKVKGIRAAVCLNETMARKAREHNDANVISLGADYMDPEAGPAIVDAFLATPFSHEARHAQRIKKMAEYEELHAIRR